jgi:hypothetical protein
MANTNTSRAPQPASLIDDLIVAVFWPALIATAAVLVRIAVTAPTWELAS